MTSKELFSCIGSELVSSMKHTIAEMQITSSSYPGPSAICHVPMRLTRLEHVLHAVPQTCDVEGGLTSLVYAAVSHNQ